MPEYIFNVLEEDKNRRLDVFISEALQKENPGFSRTYIQEVIRQGNVAIGEDIILKPNHKIKSAGQIKIKIEEKKIAPIEAEDISLDVVYEDADLAFVNKPKGLVVHPAPGNEAHTLVNALMHRFKNLSNISPERPGIVHRLDKETSGILVIAKTNDAHLNLAKQFADHTIKRRYVAIVRGKVEFDNGIIEAPISRHALKRESMTVSYSSEAKYAKTHYHTLKRNYSYSLLELEPFTGRTHQLRVHLSFLGHPILGDTKYGRNNQSERLFLHAKTLGLIHPATGKYIEFSTDIPEEFTAFCKKAKL